LIVAPDQADETREQQRRAKVAASARDAAPLKQALIQAGVDPTDFGRFVNRVVPGVIEPSTFDPEAAAPVLLAWLPRITNWDVKGSIVAHLKTRAAKRIATPALIREFLYADNLDYKWRVGDTLQYVAHHSQFDELVELAADPSHGPARQMLVDMLWRVKTPRADQVLFDSLADPDVALAAQSALRRRIGNTQARAHIEPLLDHPAEYVRKAARTHLRRIDRYLDRTSARSTATGHNNDNAPGPGTSSS
jgi:hypothetical protein